jgi:hypothetical protein
MAVEAEARVLQRLKFKPVPNWGKFINMLGKYIWNMMTLQLNK